MEFMSRAGAAARVGLEQQRRQLKAENPDLYAYVANREIAKAMDRLGDRLGNFCARSANLAWRRSAAALTDNRELIALLTGEDLDAAE